MEQEEPGEVVVGDQRELLVEPGARDRPLARVGVAGAELVDAEGGEGVLGGLAGVGADEVGEAVAEVAGEVELEPLRDPEGLGDGRGVVGEEGGGLRRAGAGRPGGCRGGRPRSRRG